MRLIKMTGGLGNQMFIYAFYMQMKRRFPTTRIDLSDMMHYRVHNGYELHRVFNLPDDEFCMNQTAKKVVEFLFFKTILERKQDLTTLRAFERRRIWPLIYFKGFYQSERYFAGITDDVRRAFTFDGRKACERTRQMAATIEADASAVSLHVRRGDYLKPGTWQTTGCVCSLTYYRDAVAALRRRVEAPHYYVFSDDIAWAAEHLPLQNAVFINWNHGADSWQDMMLMSKCRHHIICNSTFSWWGAWLNPRPDKVVVAPARWSAVSEQPYICPADWLLIPVTLPESSEKP